MAPFCNKQHNGAAASDWEQIQGRRSQLKKCVEDMDEEELLMYTDTLLREISPEFLREALISHIGQLGNGALSKWEAQFNPFNQCPGRSRDCNAPVAVPYNVEVVTGCIHPSACPCSNHSSAQEGALLPPTPPLGCMVPHTSLHLIFCHGAAQVVSLTDHVPSDPDGDLTLTQYMPIDTKLPTKIRTLQYQALISDCASPDASPDVDVSPDVIRPVTAVNVLQAEQGACGGSCSGDSEGPSAYASLHPPDRPEPDVTVPQSRYLAMIQECRTKSFDASQIERQIRFERLQDSRALTRACHCAEERPCNHCNGHPFRNAALALRERKYEADAQVMVEHQHRLWWQHEEQQAMHAYQSLNEQRRIDLLNLGAQEKEQYAELAGNLPERLMETFQFRQRVAAEEMMHRSATLHQHNERMRPSSSQSTDDQAHFYDSDCDPSMEQESGFEAEDYGGQSFRNDDCENECCWNGSQLSEQGTRDTRNDTEEPATGEILRLGLGQGSLSPMPAEAPPDPCQTEDVSVSQSRWLAALQILRIKNFNMSQLRRQLFFERGQEFRAVAAAVQRAEAREQHRLIGNSKCGYHPTADVAARTELREEQILEEMTQHEHHRWWQQEAQATMSFYENLEHQSRSDMQNLHLQEEKMEYEDLCGSMLSLFRQGFEARRQVASEQISYRATQVHEHHERMRTYSGFCSQQWNVGDAQYGTAEIDWEDPDDADLADWYAGVWQPPIVARRSYGSSADPWFEAVMSSCPPVVAACDGPMPDCEHEEYDEYGAFGFNEEEIWDDASCSTTLSNVSCEESAASVSDISLHDGTGGKITSL